MNIVVLHHQHTDPDSYKSFLLYHLCDSWQRQGHSIKHVRGIEKPLPDADLLIMHVNLTIVPREYIEMARRYDFVINRNVTDISKPVSIALAVCPGDNYTGPVIIKTRNNYGSLPEKIAYELDDNPDWSQVKWLRGYPVYDSKEIIPRQVWGNKNLVVEKFLSEKDENGYYRIREWIFMGDRDLHFMNLSTHPVVKSTNSIKRIYLTAEDVPDELRTTRSQLGFDFGKFDYVIYNGKPVLFDINKTPGSPRSVRDKSAAARNIWHLSMGLESIISK